MDLAKYIRTVENFPKNGILFKDITPLLANREAMEYCVEQLLASLEDRKIDKVAAIESRGFFFGTLLAQKLNAGFVPIRKPGKLPYHTLKETYQLEYGTDALEVHIDGISKGDRVLLHDDVLATGGTARAACNLIEKLGGIVLQCNFLLELEFLNGRDQLEGYSVHSLLKY